MMKICSVNEHSCAFTGHRPKSFPWKYDETASDCVLLKEILAAQIAMLANGGITDWFSGMAQGVDHWSAEIVLGLRERSPDMRLHCNHHADRFAVCTNRNERVQTSGRLSCRIELRGSTLQRTWR